jgi:glycosyltransferase involved in cell wall biosynthesis
MKRRICVVTAGHLATTPRMVKVANALAEEGYEVEVVSTRFTEWADEADKAVLASRSSSWSWTMVDYRRRGAFPRYVLSGIRFRVAQLLARTATVKRAPFYTAACARDRVFPELVSAILATRPEMIYGGGNALAATAVAAQRIGVPFALDLEDFHSAQDPAGPLSGVTEKIERLVLPSAALLTAGSRAIADAYHAKYGVPVTPIHNVFPLPAQAPTPLDRGDSFRLYWFGQTIGPGRGIEDAIRAVGLAGIPSELALRGVVGTDYLMALRALAAQFAPDLVLTHLPPAFPDDMVDLCRPYDVGVALERPQRYSQDLALTNKALTYILAGLAVAITDTAGQHELGTDLAEGALLCAPGDLPAMATGLKRWAQDRSLLSRAKAAAWGAAQRRWHWEHAEEKGRLLKSVAAVLE